MNREGEEIRFNNLKLRHHWKWAWMAEWISERSYISLKAKGLIFLKIPGRCKSLWISFKGSTVYHFLKKKKKLESVAYTLKEHQVFTSNAYTWSITNFLRKVITCLRPLQKTTKRFDYFIIFLVNDVHRPNHRRLLSQSASTSFCYSFMNTANVISFPKPRRKNDMALSVKTAAHNSAATLRRYSGPFSYSFS